MCKASLYQVSKPAAIGVGKAEVTGERMGIKDWEYLEDRNGQWGSGNRE